MPNPLYGTQFYINTQQSIPGSPETTQTISQDLPRFQVGKEYDYKNLAPSAIEARVEKQRNEKLLAGSSGGEIAWKAPTQFVGNFITNGLGYTIDMFPTLFRHVYRGISYLTGEVPYGEKIVDANNEYAMWLRTDEGRGASNKDMLDKKAELSNGYGINSADINEKLYSGNLGQVASGFLDNVGWYLNPLHAIDAIVTTDQIYKNSVDRATEDVNNFTYMQSAAKYQDHFSLKDPAMWGRQAGSWGITAGMIVGSIYGGSNSMKFLFGKAAAKEAVALDMTGKFMPKFSQASRVFTASFAGATSESNMEGRMAAQQAAEELTEMVNQGLITTEEAQQRTKEIQDGVTFGNFPILLASNLVIDGMLLGYAFKGKGAINRLFDESGRLVDEVPKIGKAKKSLIIGRDVVTSFATENFVEEFNQNALSSYYTKIATGELSADKSLSKRVGDYFSEYAEQFTSDQGKETMLNVGITSLLMAGIGGHVEIKNKNKTMREMYSALSANEQYWKDPFYPIYKTTEDGKVDMSSGKPEIDPVKSEKLKNDVEKLVNDGVSNINALLFIMSKTQDPVQFKYAKTQYEHLVRRLYADKMFSVLKLDDSEKGGIAVLKKQIAADAEMLMNNKQQFKIDEDVTKEDIVKMLEQDMNNNIESFKRAKKSPSVMLSEFVVHKGNKNTFNMFTEGILFQRYMNDVLRNSLTGIQTQLISSLNEIKSNRISKESKLERLKEELEVAEDKKIIQDLINQYQTELDVLNSKENKQRETFLEKYSKSISDAIENIDHNDFMMDSSDNLQHAFNDIVDELGKRHSEALKGLQENISQNVVKNGVVDKQSAAQFLVFENNLKNTADKFKTLIEESSLPQAEKDKLIKSLEETNKNKLHKNVLSILDVKNNDLQKNINTYFEGMKKQGPKDTKDDNNEGLNHEDDEESGTIGDVKTVGLANVSGIYVKVYDSKLVYDETSKRYIVKYGNDGYVISNKGSYTDEQRTKLDNGVKRLLDRKVHVKDEVYYVVDGDRIFIAVDNNTYLGELPYIGEKFESVGGHNQEQLRVLKDKILSEHAQGRVVKDMVQKVMPGRINHRVTDGSSNISEDKYLRVTSLDDVNIIKKWDGFYLGVVLGKMTSIARISVANTNIPVDYTGQTNGAIFLMIKGADGSWIPGRLFTRKFGELEDGDYKSRVVNLLSKMSNSLKGKDEKTISDTIEAYGKQLFDLLDIKGVTYQDGAITINYRQHIDGVIYDKSVSFTDSIDGVLKSLSNTRLQIDKSKLNIGDYNEKIFKEGRLKINIVLENPVHSPSLYTYGKDKLEPPRVATVVEEQGGQTLADFIKTFEKAQVVEDELQEEANQTPAQEINLDGIEPDNSGKDDYDKTLKPYFPTEERSIWSEEQELLALKDILPNVPVEVVSDLHSVLNVGGRQAMGVLRENALYIAKNAHIGTGFHEAFHAVEMLMLSKEQRENMYKEYSEKMGVEYSNASEELAEAFREYFITNYFGKKLPGKIRVFFERIKNLILRVLGLRNGFEDVFFDIAVGKYAGKDPIYSNTTVKASVPEQTINQEKLLGNINHFVLSVARDQFGHIPTVTELESYFKGLGDGELTVGVNAAYKDIYNRLLRIYKAYDDAIKAGSKNPTDIIGHSRLKALILSLKDQTTGKWNQPIRDAIFDLRNFGIKVRIANDKIYSVEQEDMVDYSEEEVEETGEDVGEIKFLKEQSGKNSQFDKLSFRCKVLLRQVKKQVPIVRGGVVVYEDVHSDIMPNAYEFLDSKILFNTIIQGIKNIHTKEGIINKLKEMSKLKPEISQVVNMLEQDPTLGTEFMMSMNNAYAKPMLTRAFGGRADLIQADRVNIQDKILDRWKQTLDYGLSSIYSNGSWNIAELNSNYNLIVGLSDALVQFKNTNDPRALNAINELALVMSNSGILITTDSLSRIYMSDRLVDFTSALKNAFQYIVDNSHKDSSIISISKENFNADIKKLSNVLTDSSFDIHESTYLNANNEKEYGHRLPNFLFRFLNDIRNSGSIDNSTFSDVGMFFNDEYFVSVLRDSAFLKQGFDILIHSGERNLFNRGTAYSDFSGAQFERNSIIAYMNDLSRNLANIRLSVMGESPVAYFLVYKKLNTVEALDFLEKSYESEKRIIEYKINRFYEFQRAEQDLSSDNTETVRKAKQTLLKKIKNYDVDRIEDAKPVIFGYIKGENVRQELEDALSDRFEQYKSVLREKGIMVDGVIDGVFSENLESDLKNYYYHSYLARVSSTLVMFGHPTFADKFSKRYKDIHSPYTNLDVDAEYNGQKINGAFTALYSSDVIQEEPNIDLSSLDISEEQKKYILKRLGNLKVTDGQGYCTLDRLKEIMIGSAKWSDEHELAYINAKSGNATFEDLKLLAKPIKMKYMSTDMDDIQKTPMPKDHKYTVAPLIPQLIKGNKYLESVLGALNKLQLSANLNAEWVYAPKLGQYGDAINDPDFVIESGMYHVLNNQQAGIQQELGIKWGEPVIIGSQQFKRSMADMPENITVGDKEYSKKEAFDEYSNLFDYLYSTSFEEWTKKFNSPFNLLETLREQQSGKLSSVDSRDAFLPVENKDFEAYSDWDVRPRLPFAFPSNAVKTQQVLCASGRQMIARQKSYGGSIVQTSAAGDKGLKIVIKDGKIDHIQCKLPMWIKDRFGDSFNGNISKISQDVLDMIGYRIPTENSYSMYRLKPVGWDETGLKLPPEVVKMSDTDFDGDKFWIKIPYTYTDKNGVVKKVKFIDGDTNSEEFLKDFYNQKHRFLSIIEDKLSKVESTDKSFDELILSMFPKDSEIDKELQEAIGEELTPEEIGVLQKNGLTVEQFEELKSNREKFIKENLGKSIYEINGEYAVKNRILDFDYAALGTKAYSNTAITGGGARFLDGIISDLGINPDIDRELFFADSEIDVFERYMLGSDVIGIAANNNSAHFLLQQTDLGIVNAVEFDNEKSESLNKENSFDGRTITSNIAQTLSAAVDNPSIPKLSLVNLNRFTANTFYSLLHLGFNLKPSIALISQESIREFTNSVLRDGSSMRATKSNYIRLSQYYKEKSVDSKLDLTVENLIKYGKRFTEITKTKNLILRQLNIDIKNNPKEEETLRLIAQSKIDGLYTREYYAMQYAALEFFNSINETYAGIINKVTRAIKPENKLGPTLWHTMDYLDLVDEVKDSKLLTGDAFGKLTNSLIENGVRKPLNFLAPRINTDVDGVKVNQLYPYRTAKYEHAYMSMKGNKMDGKLSAKEREIISNFLSVYQLIKEYPLFQKYNIATLFNNMPKMLIRMQQLFGDSEYNELLQYLDVDGKNAKSYNTIIFRNDGSLSDSQKKTISETWKKMLFDESEVDGFSVSNFAEQLIVYSVYQSALMFTPRTLSSRIPVQFYENAFDGNESMLKYFDKINTSDDTGNLMAEFEEIFMKNYFYAENFCPNMPRTSTILNRQGGLVTSFSLTEEDGVVIVDNNIVRPFKYIKNNIVLNGRRAYVLYKYQDLEVIDGVTHYIYSFEESLGIPHNIIEVNSESAFDFNKQEWITNKMQSEDYEEVKTIDRNKIIISNIRSGKKTGMIFKAEVKDSLKNNTYTFSTADDSQSVELSNITELRPDDSRITIERLESMAKKLGYETYEEAFTNSSLLQSLADGELESIYYADIKPITDQTVNKEQVDKNSPEYMKIAATNYAKKYGITLEEAIDQINSALFVDPEGIKKILDECYGG